MNKTELLEIQHKLEKLKENYPYKYYELKGIIEGLYLAKIEKNI